MNRNYILLPGTFRFAGILFFLTGIFLGVIRFYFGVKPDLLDMKPFAFYSSYVENKYMQFIGNNMSEEIVGLLILCGLFLIAFSRDKVENELKAFMRVKALYLTVYAQIIFLILSILFTFGFAFVYMLMANMVFPIIFFLLSFRIFLFIHRKNKSTLF
jgi:branched-subunit amino acid transport protein AzlD